MRKRARSPVKIWSPLCKKNGASSDASDDGDDDGDGVGDGGCSTTFSLSCSFSCSFLVCRVEFGDCSTSASQEEVKVWSMNV